MWKLALAAVVIVAVAGTAVGVAIHMRRETDELRCPGTVEIQEVRLSSRVGGRVAKVFVKESQIVEPGAPIVELEMPELDAQRDQLAAQKSASEAVLDRLEHGPRAEEKAAAKAAME